MKVFFDTNVYVAEALLGQMAQQLLEATRQASWRIYTSRYVLEELGRVMTEQLGFSQRLTLLTQKRISRWATMVAARTPRHKVPGDLQDSPILQAALSAGADYLVTNDRHLLLLSPYEGLRMISMSAYHRLLLDEGLLT